MDYLNLCAIVKDEDPLYLREWVDYHLRAGCDHIILYDNESSISPRRSLKNFIKRGSSWVIDCPGKGMQHAAYAHCLQHFGVKTQWMAFIDADEFIVPRKAVDLRHFLQDYESYGGLAVNWLLFGSGGHIHKPGTSQIEHFVMRTGNDYANNRLVKSIVQPRYTLMPMSAHHFLYRHDKFCVNERFQRVDGQESQTSSEHISIFHYYCRSRQEFELKVKRGKADDNYRLSSEIPLANFEQVDLAAATEDTSLKERYAELRRQPLPAVSALPANALPLMLDSKNMLVERFLSLVQAAQSSGDLATCDSLMTIMPSWYGGFEEWHLGLADFFIINELYEPAWQQILAAWHLAPRSLPVLKLIGKYYYARKEYAQAESSFAAVLELDKHDTDAVISLAQLYSETGRKMQSVVMLQKALLADPQNSAVQTLINQLNLPGIDH